MNNGQTISTLEAAVPGAGVGLSPSIPVRSKRLELGLAGGMLHSLGKLGGGAGRKSNGKCPFKVKVYP